MKVTISNTVVAANTSAKSDFYMPFVSELRKVDGAWAEFLSGPVEDVSIAGRKGAYAFRCREHIDVFFEVSSTQMKLEVVLEDSPLGEYQSWEAASDVGDFKALAAKFARKAKAAKSNFAKVVKLLSPFAK